MKASTKRMTKNTKKSFGCYLRWNFCMVLFVYRRSRANSWMLAWGSDTVPSTKHILSAAYSAVSYSTICGRPYLDGGWQNLQTQRPEARQLSWPWCKYDLSPAPTGMKMEGSSFSLHGSAHPSLRSLPCFIHLSSLVQRFVVCSLASFPLPAQNFLYMLDEANRKGGMYSVLNNYLSVWNDNRFNCSVVTQRRQRKIK